MAPVRPTPVIALFPLLLVACSRMGGIGSNSDPIHFFFTPFGDTESIADNMAPLLSFLEQETGYAIRLAVPTSNMDVIEGLGDGSVDVAMMNSFGYLLAKAQYDAELRLSIVRRGAKTYRGMIITHVDSGIRELTDLEGQVIAFTEKASGSGYLMPRKLLMDKGVSLGSSQFVQRHDSVVEMVYHQQVLAGACFYGPTNPDGSLTDARSLIIDQYPDVAEKVKIIAHTEPIPNGGLVFSKTVPEEVATKLEEALLTYLATDEGKAFFAKHYKLDELASGDDNDYNPLRKALRQLNMDPIELIQESTGF